MGVQAKHDTLGIKKVLKCSIRIGYRCASEHWALFSLALLLYLLYRSSPGLFAFILSSSPVIICATLLLGILLSYGSTHLPESVEDRKTGTDCSAPKFGCFSRNAHFEAQQGFSVPAVKENKVGFKCWEFRNPSFGKERDENVPLLKGSVDQGDERVYAHDRLAEVFTSIPSVVTLQQEVGLEEFMKTKHERESKDPFCSNDKSTEYASLFEDADQKRVDEKEATFGLCPSSRNDGENGEAVAKENQDRVVTDSQSDNVREASEDEPAKKQAGTCKWGRAFSVRQRKKLDGIKIEAINVDFSSQIDSALVSPCATVSDHDVSSGFDSGKPESSSSDITMVDVAPMLDDIDPPLGNDDSFKLESSSCVITMADVAPVLDEIDPPLCNEFPSPDPIGNDDSGCGSNFCCQDSEMDSGNNNKADTSKAGNDAKDGEVNKDDGGNQPEFLGTADEDKNAMDLGYSEVERSRRLEFMMAKRRSRKNIIFDLDGNDACQSADRFSRFRMQVQPISVSRRSPFDLASDPDEAAIPGSAPSIMHRRNNLFEPPSEQSDDSSVSAHDNLDSQEIITGSRRDMIFKRHDTFNFGGQERQCSRFKPCFVLDAMDIQEEMGIFQRQFSDKSVSKLSAVSECDTLSSAADQEECKNLVKKDFQRWFSDKSMSRLSVVSESDTLSLAADQEECNDLIKKDFQRWFNDKSMSRLSVVSGSDALSLVADQEERSDFNKDFLWYFQRQFSDKSMSKVTIVSESDALSLVADQEERADFNKDFLWYFQRQFSDKSVSKQSVVTESDIISSVADQEDRSDLVEKDVLLGDTSPELPRQESDLGSAGREMPGHC
ncbi:uncharacterized protein LOC119348759 [Triticum dicoccoides]|uniref:uncharacterized protein LOC119348759 n=1 Tax=Triticum dicoccoides TaxID=85692 RepID=UPI000E7D1778|nr:uncharacterized protein LOC119348759 [Triticum dicoccoides]XP_037472645.1 uncharacterized protein LOC119348759 [Triticum dicoccoides]XP_037472646.1 uncharacterized protein LOC119348759 [Triticum dicoccoides]